MNSSIRKELIKEIKEMGSLLGIEFNIEKTVENICENYDKYVNDCEVKNREEIIDNYYFI